MFDHVTMRVSDRRASEAINKPDYYGAFLLDPDRYS